MALKDQLHASVALPHHPLGMRIKVDARPGLEYLKKKKMFIEFELSGFK
jgi:hypothetical protein